jgi:hypothetical protein
MKYRAGSVAWLREIYRNLNKEYFRNKLPKRFKIEWTTLNGTIVACVRWKAYATIYRKGKKTNVSTKYKPTVMQFDRKLKGRFLQKQVGMSMLHEMAHLKLGAMVDCKDWDGPFDKEMFRLAKAGAFQRFW